MISTSASFRDWLIRARKGQSSTLAADQDSRRASLPQEAPPSSLSILSEAMLTLTRERVPGLVVVTADMRTLPFAAGSLGGAVALYVLHHLPRGDLLLALLELRRTLVSNAPLLIATHMGVGEVASGDTWLGHDVEPLAGTLFQPEEMESALREASFATDAVMTRNPLPHEYQGLRIYVRARAVERPKPASAHR
jgi:SAM-dependent methyltransferase